MNLIYQHYFIDDMFYSNKLQLWHRILLTFKEINVFLLFRI